MNPLVFTCLSAIVVVICIVTLVLVAIEWVKKSGRY